MKKRKEYKNWYVTKEVILAHSLTREEAKDFIVKYKGKGYLNLKRDGI